MNTCASLTTSFFAVRPALSVLRTRLVTRSLSLNDVLLTTLLPHPSFPSSFAFHRFVIAALSIVDREVWHEAMYSSAFPVPAPAGTTDYVHAPPLGPVVPPRAFAVTLTRTARPHRCRTPSRVLPCPSRPASTSSSRPPRTPVSLRVHTRPMRCHARSVPPPPALSSLSPQRPSRSVSTLVPLARVLPSLPPCTLPLRAPVSIPACQSSPAYAPLPRRPPLRPPLRTRLRVATPIPLRIRPAAEPLSRTHTRANLCVGTGASSAQEHGAVASTPASLCGDTLIESRLHFCAVCPPRRPRPHDVCIPLLQPYPPLLLRTHHLASEYTKSAYHTLAPMEPRKLLRAPPSVARKVRESNRFRECIDRVSEGF
ncbi:hypothetical protein DFH08DRAFT_1024592 [Mycena albidolilacea]|uniref:Uncharacterized protein n=1 Tax=Mycena albidolilacea TaxID=1033008 RepID=A0AAD7ALP1_9AGAR|nr:hypothetical protein DFH08DRAFT_1024592 [Mycena albidolilacea]